MAKILNVGTHAIDLDDGRTLAPGEEADGIDVEDPHNKSVIDCGLAMVVEDAKKKTSGEDKNS